MRNYPLGLKNNANKSSFLLVVIAGFLFSFAILGRQTFLLILLCLPFLGINFDEKFNFKTILKVIDKQFLLLIGFGKITHYKISIRGVINQGEIS